MDTLSGILEEISRVREEQKPAPVAVDVTRFTGRDEKNPLIITWVSPTVRQVYLISDDAAELLKDNMDWNSQLALDVATLAWCHAAPDLGDMPKGLFYAAIANGNPEMFFYLITRLQQAFPHLKGDATDQNLLIDLCAQYYRLHPEECSHLPSRVIGQLKQISEHKKSKSVVV